MSGRWLLVLGSDAPDGAPIQSAIGALRELGTVETLTPARRFQDDDGTGRLFTNRLVQLESPAGDEGLRGKLHAVERRIGRTEHSDRVLIDIDLLARAGVSGAWRLDPYAMEKGEHLRPHVVALLNEAAISL
ncbi:MAG: hypothetical protein GX538_07380 [Gammaproteobacteria bacterium]|nr:hypothetical protein [Gammaproteobacteria bacterium]